MEKNDWLLTKEEKQAVCDKVRVLPHKRVLDAYLEAQLSKVFKDGKDQCAYCGTKPDGAMLTMGPSMAHVPCVILKLNELLDPNYEGFGPADETVGFLSKYVI